MLIGCPLCKSYSTDDITFREGSCQSSTTLAPVVTASPSTTMDCDFEIASACNWNDDSQQPWYFATANMAKYRTMPTMDHTKRNGQGYFAYVHNSLTNNVDNRQAVMHMRDRGVPHTGGPVCLRLWYYIRGKSYSRLNVSVLDTDNNLVNVFIREYDQGEQWNLMELEINEHNITSGPYTYRISGLVQQGVVAIDDISVEYRTCAPLDPNTFRCTFESGHNCSFTATYDSLHSQLQWQLYRGDQTNLRARDHTTKSLFGHFYAIDFYQTNTVINNNHRILSQWFGPTAQACVTFSYYMSRLKSSEALNIYVDTETLSSRVPLWSAATDLGPFWYTHRVGVSSTVQWRVGFDVSTSNTVEGMIAIDDVIVQLDRDCPLKGRCDFENKDMCLWESLPPNRTNIVATETKESWASVSVGRQMSNTVLYYTDFEGFVHSPDIESLDSYPDRDHTLNRRSGNYLAFDMDRTEGDRAVLVSDHYDLDQKRTFCLSFFYQLNEATTGQVIPRFEVYASENGFGQSGQIDKIGQVLATPGLTTDWTRFSVTARAKTSDSQLMCFYLVSDCGTAAVLAIDDISVVSGHCMDIDKDLFNCSDTQVIARSKVCDGVKDCANGADELDCGSCDFRNDQNCGYNLTDTYDPKYVWRFGNSSLGPDQGPSFKLPWFIVAQTLTTNAYLQQTQIYSPTILESAAGCQVHFKYNMYGLMQNPEHTIPEFTRYSHLQVYVYREGFEKTEIWNSDALGVVEKQWTAGVALVGRVSTRFRIAFVATDRTQYYDSGSYVALAGIEMVGCRTDQRTECSTWADSFKCRKSNCISKEYVCDFTDDCGDSTDESSAACTDYKLRCDFEDGLCRWGLNQPINAVNKWQLSTGFSEVIYGPTRDHTKGVKSGKYLLISDQTSGLQSVIMGPMLEPSTDCYMRLWYSMEGNITSDGWLRVGYQDMNTGYVESDIWRTSPSVFPMQTFGWSRAIVSLKGIANTFRVVITGNLSRPAFSNPSYIALDDISFTPGCIVSDQQPGDITATPIPFITTPVSACGRTEFLCRTSGPTGPQCIASSKVCDFHKDCSDNSDEDQCGSCDFDEDDQNMCGWNNVGTGKNQWVVKKAEDYTNFNDILPDQDADGDKNGRFLIITTSMGGTLDVPAQMSTPPLGATGPDCRLTFAYRHTKSNLIGRDPQDKAKLTIHLFKKSRFRTSQKILRDVLEYTVGWNNYTVHIGTLNSPGYQIQMSGHSQVKVAGYMNMELDNIKFIDCDPYAPGPGAGLSCDFEDGTCGWFDWQMDMMNKQLDWERTNDLNVEPDHDHTRDERPRPPRYGYWMYTRRMPAMKGNNTATLMSQQKQRSTASTQCLTFWYYMFGFDPANFTLMANNLNSPFSGRPQVLWLKRQPQSNRWVRAQVNVMPQKYDYYLMFVASLVDKVDYTLSEDIIGLDDITYTDGSCPPQPVCDFETDYCDWTYNKNEFVRLSPVMSSMNETPAVDHTMGAADGHYLKVGVINRDVRLTYNLSYPSGSSSGSSSDKCLKFYYYMGSPMNTQSNQDYYYVQTVEYKWGDWSADYLSLYGLLDQWLYFRLTLKDVSASDEVTIGAKISSNSSVMAFDDILVQDVACEQPGWCDFENDLCGWSNVAPGNGIREELWVRNQGQTKTGYGAGPRVDHTTHTSEGWYVYVPQSVQNRGVATLKSELLTPAGTVCFSFYYNILEAGNYAGSQDKVRLMYASPKWPRPMDLANLTNVRTSEWLLFNVTLSNMPPGWFVIETYQPIRDDLAVEESFSDVAIDDIRLKRGACGDTVTTNLIPSTPTTPEPQSEDQWDCDFEGIRCNWSIDKGGWTRTSWNANQKVGPRVDHTHSSAFGQYLLFDSHTTNAPNPVTFTSGQVTDPYKYYTAACFSFWYYIDTESKFNLTFGYISPGAGYVSVYRVSERSVSRTWKRAQVTYYNVLDSQLSIQLQRGQGVDTFVGGVAIDDIRLAMGECQYTDGMECTFNNADRGHYCGYQVLEHAMPATMSGTGIIRNALNPRVLFGPTADHTTGEPSGFFFWMAKPSNNLSASYRTDIEMVALPATQFRPKCLTFWYQIDTLSTTAFDIFVVPDTQTVYTDSQWQVPYNQFGQWTRGQLTVSAYFKHKIVLSLNLEATAPTTSFVALDDISLTDGWCEAPVSCDFDADWCSWGNTGRGNWNWAKFTGPPGIDVTWIGPRYDHSIQRSGGSYLYMTVPVSDIDAIGVIESMPTSLKTSKCIAFWSQLIGHNASIEVSVKLYGQSIAPKDQIRVLSGQISEPTQGWHKYQFTVDAKHLPNVKQFSVRLTGKVAAGQKFIALDDIVLSEGKCRTTETDLLFCDDGKAKQYSLAQRCDFVYDCPNHDDEQDCAECDFEQDTCGWSNRYSIGQQWVRKVASDKSLPIGPDTDGQGESNGHYMIIDPRSQYSITAQLLSNSSAIRRLKKSYSTCQMVFKYSMTTKAVNEDSAFFTVSLGADLYTRTIVWRMTGTTHSWNKATVHIGDQDAPFTIDIVGATDTQNQMLAIDDIHFQHCAPPPSTTTGQCGVNQVKCRTNNVCITRFGLCDNQNDCGDQWDESSDLCAQIKTFSCTFDYGFRFASNCNWTSENENGTKSIWTVMSTKEASSDINLARMTGPTRDHTFRSSTNGHFLVLQSQPSDFGKKSKLVTRWITSRANDTCALRLFYYMFGEESQLGSLSIYVRYGDTSIQSQVTPLLVTGNEGQQWKRAIVANNDQHSDQKPFQFVIEGIAGTGLRSDIAIDDVTMSAGCLASYYDPVEGWTTTTVTTESIAHSSATSARTQSKSTTESSAGHQTVSTVETTKTTHRSQNSSVSSDTTQSNSGRTTTMTMTITDSTPTTKHLRHTDTTSHTTTTSVKIAIDKSDNDRNKSKTGPIVAGVVVPIAVVAFIIAALYYRRYKSRREEEERLALSTPSHRRFFVEEETNVDHNY